MKTKRTTPEIKTTICNAVIESVSIGLEPDGTPIVRVLVTNPNEFPLSLEWYKRSFGVPCIQAARSKAEATGCRVFAIAWCLDLCFNLFDAVGQVVRVKHSGGDIMGLGHAVQERWLERETRMDLVYPFFTGAPSFKNEPNEQK